MHLERIPGFAVCARCGVRRALQPCRQCGLITCKDCRGDSQCAICYGERLRAAVQAARRARWQAVVRHAGVVACVAACGLGAVGAAMLPDAPPPLESDAHLVIVARGEARFVGDAVDRYAAAHGASCPSSLESLRNEGYLLGPPIDPWGEPLLFGCVEGPRAFVVMSKGPDRMAGTDDDIIFAAP